MAEEAQQPPQQQHGEAKPEQQPQRPETPEQRRHRRRILWGAGLAAAVIAALVVLWWVIFKRGFVSTDDAYTDGRAISIAAKVAGYVAAARRQRQSAGACRDRCCRISPLTSTTHAMRRAGGSRKLQAQLEAARMSLDDRARGAARRTCARPKPSARPRRRQSSARKRNIDAPAWRRIRSRRRGR